MPTHFIRGYQGGPIQILVQGTDMKMTRNATVISNADAIVQTAQYEGTKIGIAGHIVAFSNGISAIGTGTAIRVERTGVIDAWAPINTGGDAVTINNAGRLIAAGQGAILAFGDGVSIRNSGMIEGGGGVYVTGDDAKVVNADGAKIISLDVGVRILGDAGHTSTIRNDGLIMAMKGAVTGSDATDKVINRGLIAGNVLLHEGDDLFDSRGGRVTGTIFGSLGNDTFVLGKSYADIHEAANQGVDTVRSTVSYQLRANFENLVLSDNDDVDGRGNELSNEIRGNAGKNRLFGGEGDDQLYGGAGRDTLEGGAGIDIFHFETGGDRDVISDFEANVDFIRLANWKAIRDYDDLVDNHVEQRGANVVITAGKDSLTLLDFDLALMNPADFLL